MRDSGMLEDMISRSTFVDVFNHIALAAAPDAKAQKRKMDPFLPLPFWYNTHTHTQAAVHYILHTLLSLTVQHTAPLPTTGYTTCSKYGQSHGMEK